MIKAIKTNNRSSNLKTLEYPKLMSGGDNGHVYYVISRDAFTGYYTGIRIVSEKPGAPDGEYSSTYVDLLPYEGSVTLENLV